MTEAQIQMAEELGWQFRPSHDRGGVAVPDSWEDPDGVVHWDINPFKAGLISPTTNHNQKHHMDKSQNEIEARLAALKIDEDEAWKTLQAFTNGDAWKSANATRDNLTRIWCEIQSKVRALETLLQ